MHISALDETGKPIDWWFLHKKRILVASFLAKICLILAPPGHTREQALKLIQSTHIVHGTTPAAKDGTPQPDAKPAKEPKKKSKKTS